MSIKFYAPSTVAFHGCDLATALGLLDGRLKFLPSENDYDWLGPGVYFFDSNPLQALEFAKEKAHRARLKGLKFEPAVLGVKLKFNHRLELTSKPALELTAAAYEKLKFEMSEVNQADFERLTNITTGCQFHKLDCAVFQMLHYWLEEQNIQAYDTIRGTFIGKTRVYKDACFCYETHVQICVRNNACISEIFMTTPNDFL